MIERHLSCTVVNGPHKASVTLEGPQLDAFPSILTGLLPLFHFLGWPTATVRIVDGNEIVLKLDKSIEFVTVDPPKAPEEPINSIYEDEEELRKAEEALFADFSEVVESFFKVGDRVKANAGMGSWSVPAGTLGTVRQDSNQQSLEVEWDVGVNGYGEDSNWCYVKNDEISHA